MMGPANKRIHRGYNEQEGIVGTSDKVNGKEDAELPNEKLRKTLAGEIYRKLAEEEICRTGLAWMDSN